MNAMYLELVGFYWTSLGFPSLSVFISFIHLLCVAFRQARLLYQRLDLLKDLLKDLTGSSQIL